MAGLLHVSAQILEPRKLSVEAFDEWYEEVCYYPFSSFQLGIERRRR
jgi:hypothetical protein